MNAKPNKLKKFSIWIRLVTNWFVHGLTSLIWYAVPILVILGITYIDNPVTSCKEQDIRSIGLLFQIIGFGIILYQINSRLRLFRKPSFLLRIQKFFRRFPSPYTKTINLSLEPVTVEISVSKPEITLKPNHDAPLEERVKILESEIQSLKKRSHQIERALGDHKVESMKSFHELQDKINSNYSEIKQLIDDAVVGEISLEWIGILYFIVGICLATASSEIAIILGYAGHCSIPAR